jgi:predicted phage tail protein
MIPGFERELMTSKDRGIKYAVFVGKRNITERELEYPSGNDDIRVAPIPVGAKNGGILSVIAGVVLIIAGAVTSYFGGAGTPLISLGVSMVFGGVAQMLSAHAAASNGNSNSAATKTSYYFSGAENTAYQGGPVPLLYGRMRVGSTVISEGILATDT